MNPYSKEELEEALKIITSTIGRCEKAQPDFSAGTSQHTLLKNRLKALYLSKALMSGENIEERYVREDLEEALRPVASIISKCEKAQQKWVEGTAHHTRFKKLIQVMTISVSLITDEIRKRDSIK